MYQVGDFYINKSEPQNMFIILSVGFDKTTGKQKGLMVYKEGDTAIREWDEAALDINWTKVK